jgi:hypothetical protein
MLHSPFIFHCYSAHSFLVAIVCMAAQSFCKMTELGRERAWAGGDTQLGRGRGCA